MLLWYAYPAGILFKFAVDTVGIYSGDEYSSKAGAALHSSAATSTLLLLALGL
jgi:hypothetical protein